MGQQLKLGLRQGSAGVSGVGPVGGGEMIAQDVDRRPFVFEPPRNYTDKSGIAWLVQWIDNQTVVVLSPLRDGTDLITWPLDNGRCQVAVSAPAGVVVPDYGRSQFFS